MPIKVEDAPFENTLRPVECEYQQIKQRLLKKIEWLEEENAELRKEKREFIERSDYWRNEKLAVQAELQGENDELRQEIQRLNKALEIHAEDEALLFGISRKLGSMGVRL